MNFNKLITIMIVNLFLLSGSLMIINGIEGYNNEESVPRWFAPGAFSSGGNFAGGDGSAGNPFVITDVFDLQNMSANLNAHYVLANDINAVVTKSWNNGAGFLPIGNDPNQFKGSLDGNGNEIISLYIDRPGVDGIGLFGVLNNTGVIKNTGLTGQSTKFEGFWAVGGLAGWNEGLITNCFSTISVIGYESVGGLAGFNRFGTISNSYATGSVTVNGSQDIGGFVGLNEGGTIVNSYATGSIILKSGKDTIGGFVGLNDVGGTIANCYATGSVNGNRSVGGFVGWNYGSITNSYAEGSVISISYNVGGFAGYNGGAGTISNCYSTGSASGSNQVGGFIGRHFGGTITNCFSTGNASGTSDSIGGFAGRNNAAITYSYSTGSASGATNYAGGFVGYNDAGAISNSYATGSASGTDQIGGFAGRNDVSITNCYSTGSTSGTDQIGGFVGRNIGSGTTTNCYSTGNASGSSQVGGFAGSNTASITNCYWDNITSGRTNSFGGVGKNTTEMKQQGTFTNWNFTSPWGIVENEIYPYLITLKPIINPQYLTLLTHAKEDMSYGNSFEALSQIHPAGNKPGNWTVFTNTAGWLSFNSTNVVLSGIPTNADVGVYFVNVTVSDSLGTKSSFNYTLTVANVDPNIKTSDITEAIAGQQYENDYESTDDGQGTITWSRSTNAGWLNIDSNTGVLSGTPPDNQVGTYWVIVSVSDGNGGVDNTNFTVTVTDVNNDPVITTTPGNNAIEGSLYSVMFNATDVDPASAVFTWTLQTNAGWLILDGYYLHGTPGSSDVDTFWVNISVSDGHGGSDDLNFSVSVTDINNAPVITTTPATTATEDSEYSLNLTGADPDPGDKLTWVLAEGPSWLSLTNGVLNGTPANADVGSSLVELSVNDSGGKFDTLEFMLTVANTNDNPVITTDPPHDTAEDSQYSVKFTATDEDPVPTVLQWTLDTDAAWLELDGSHLHGTPGNSDVGTFPVNITVSDGMGGSDYLQYTLNVTNTNDAPEWNTIPSVQIITEGVALNLNSLATDVDGDRITYSISSIPTTNITIDTSSGDIKWSSPTVGIYIVTITATDGAVPIEHSFDVIVTAVLEDPDPDPDPDKNVTTPETDTDSDGMPDWWEEFYGFDPEEASDAQGDPDNDDKTNLQEYTARTSPLKDDSVKSDVVDDDKKDDDKKDSEAQGLESPAVSIPLGLIIGVIIGIVVGMMMRARKKPESPDDTDAEEELEE